MKNVIGPALALSIFAAPALAQEPAGNLTSLDGEVIETTGTQAQIIGRAQYCLSTILDYSDLPLIVSHDPAAGYVVANNVTLYGDREGRFRSRVSILARDGRFRIRHTMIEGHLSTTGWITFGLGGRGASMIKAKLTAQSEEIAGCIQATAGEW